MDLLVGRHLSTQSFKITNLPELRTQLTAVREEQYCEPSIGIDENPGEEGTYYGIIALVNGDRSFLAYFRYDGDTGFSSRDPT
jgi:hypothetical protein